MIRTWRACGWGCRYRPLWRPPNGRSYNEVQQRDCEQNIEEICGTRKSHASTWNPWPADDFITCFRRKDHEPRFPLQNVMLFCLGSSYLLGESLKQKLENGGVPIPWLKIESPQPLRMRAEIQKLSAYRKGLSRSNRIFTLCGTLAEVPEYRIPHTPLIILIDLTYQQMHNYVS